jgi:hypothetical protein
MKRRNFIALTTLGAAAVSIPFLNCGPTTTALEKKLALPQALSRITDENDIIAIGKAYGNIHAEEYAVKTLEQQLQKNSQGGVVAANTPEKDIDTFLEKNIYDDLDQGNTIVLNGWVLSITEARQCALFSLTR